MSKKEHRFARNFLLYTASSAAASRSCMSSVPGDDSDFSDHDLHVPPSAPTIYMARCQGLPGPSTGTVSTRTGGNRVQTCSSATSSCCMAAMSSSTGRNRLLGYDASIFGNSWIYGTTRSVLQSRCTPATARFVVARCLTGRPSAAFVDMAAHPWGERHRHRIGAATPVP